MSKRDTVDFFGKRLSVDPRAPKLTQTLEQTPSSKRPMFVALGPAVMRGSQIVARAISKTMAKRIAKALNRHKTNAEGTIIQDQGDKQ